MDLTIAQALCERFEGFKSKPYLCPAGIPTIGFGSTYYKDGRRVTLQDPPITVEEARLLLLSELNNTYLLGVLRQCPGLALDINKLNAITDFAYNLGVGRLQISTLKRKINAGQWEDAIVELKKWNKGGGKVLKGLTLRRDTESLLMK